MGLAHEGSRSDLFVDTGSWFAVSEYRKNHPKPGQADDTPSLQIFDDWRAMGRMESPSLLPDDRRSSDRYLRREIRCQVCLARHRDALLAFYDFPAQNWDRLRTTTCRLRALPARGLVRWHEVP